MNVMLTRLDREAIRVKSRRWRDGGRVLCEGTHGVQAQHWGMAK